MNKAVSPSQFARAGQSSGPACYRIDAVDPALHTYLNHTFQDASEEQLHVIYCDAMQQYLHDEILAHGTSHLLVTRVRPIFSTALSLGARAILLAHNHPSGNCQPSATDIRSTRYLRDVANVLEIELLDHLIFTRKRCFSMASGGYL